MQILINFILRNKYFLENIFRRKYFLIIWEFAFFVFIYFILTGLNNISTLKKNKFIH